MNHDKFIYKKIIRETEKNIAYEWFLINRSTREGVHFHGMTYKDDGDYGHLAWCFNEYKFNANGIEMHSKTPAYEGHKPIEDCEVTQGDCYCDGSSLIAQERLGHINPKEDDSLVWSVLRSMYRNWFEEEEYE